MNRERSKDQEIADLDRRIAGMASEINRLSTALIEWKNKANYLLSQAALPLPEAHPINRYRESQNRLDIILDYMEDCLDENNRR